MLGGGPTSPVHVPRAALPIPHTRALAAAATAMAKTMMMRASPALLLLAMVSLASLALQQAQHASATGECAAMAAVQLAHWSFDGTYDDLSRAQRGPAIPAWDRAPVGGNIKMGWDDSPSSDDDGDGSCAGYVRVGNPGYLELPRVDFQNTSFTFSFSIRLNGQMADRRILYADWSQDKWQFLSWITPDRNFFIWLRSSGCQPKDAFVSLTSSAKVPLGQWTDIAFNWDRSSRTASVLFNRQRVGCYTVPATVSDINLCKSNSYYHQFGSKADSSSQESKDYSPLDADVRNLRVFTGFILAEGEGDESAAKPALLEQVVSGA